MLRERVTLDTVKRVDLEPSEAAELLKQSARMTKKKEPDVLREIDGAWTFGVGNQSGQLACFADASLFS